MPDFYFIQLFLIRNSQLRLFRGTARAMKIKEFIVIQFILIVPNYFNSISKFTYGIQNSKSFKYEKSSCSERKKESVCSPVVSKQNGSLFRK